MQMKRDVRPCLQFTEIGRHGSLLHVAEEIDIKPHTAGLRDISNRTRKFAERTGAVSGLERLNGGLQDRFLHTELRQTFDARIHGKYLSKN
jgi:hypothetical protein